MINTSEMSAYCVADGGTPEYRNGKRIIERWRKDAAKHAEDRKRIDRERREADERADNRLTLMWAYKRGRELARMREIAAAREVAEAEAEEQGGEGGGE